MPRLQWQPIKNLLRLHSVKLSREKSVKRPNRMHWVTKDNPLRAWVIRRDWWSHPDPQAYVIEQIMFIAGTGDIHAR